MRPLPAGPYGVVYADPPWTFATRSTKGRGRCPDGRGHYDVMTLVDIMALPVADVCAEDAALLLWATDPLLPVAFEVGRAWGFTYQTVGFYWAKQTRTGKRWHMGMGYWTRANPEPCLLFTRGKPRRLSRGVRKLIEAPVREHSRKPDEVRERIEALLPGPRLEMFARSTAPGWDAWGDQVGALDEAA